MKLFLAVPLLALALPAAAMFKCQAADGKTTFQEIPCAGASEKQTSVRTYVPPPDPSAPPERPAAERSAVNQAIVGSYPVRGMSLKELQTAMGNPSRVNTGDYPGGYNEQRIYERDGGTIYVYTENGIVRSIQTTENPRGAAPVQTARACASAHDIKNEEVSANSIMLNDEQRRERYRKIERMKACRD